MEEIRRVQNAPQEELMTLAKELGAPYELVLEVKRLGRLPVVNFAAGGIATPADAALMMQLGCDGIFVGSGIFKSDNPAARARAIVEATTHFNDPGLLAKVSRGIGETDARHLRRQPGREGTDRRTGMVATINELHGDIGVLALQGAVREHLHSLAQLRGAGTAGQEAARISPGSGRWPDHPGRREHHRR